MDDFLVFRYIKKTFTVPVLSTVDKFHYVNKSVFTPGKLGGLTLVSVFISMGLGFCLSLLFFMDQNISGAMVNSPENRWVGSAVTSTTIYFGQRIYYKAVVKVLTYIL